MTHTIFVKHRIFFCLSLFLLCGASAQAQGVTQDPDSLYDDLYDDLHDDLHVQTSKEAVSFKPFSVGLGLVTGVTATSRGTMLFPLWIEPQILLKSREVSLGVRFEAFLPRILEPPGKILAYTMRVDYFLVNRYPFRVSVGLGLGAYRYKFYGEDVESSCILVCYKVVEEGTSLGVAPRFRAQWYFLEFGLAVHISKHSFVAMQLGFQIYGKKRHTPKQQ